MKNFTIANTKELEYFVKRTNTDVTDLRQKILQHLPELVNIRKVEEMELFGIPLEYIYPISLLVSQILDVMHKCGIEKITDTDYDMFNQLILEEC